MKLTSFLAFVTFFLGCAAPKQSNLQDASQDESHTFLCNQLTSKRADFKYEERFADEVRNKVSKEELIKVLDGLVTTHGECVDVEAPASGKHEDGSNVVMFETNRGRRLVFVMAKNGAGLILSFTFKTSVPSKDYFDIAQTTVRMRDGAELVTQIFKKRGGANRAPVVMTRTPYFKFHGAYNFANYLSSAEYFLERGYHFVLQSIRGTHGSEGEYKYLHPHEIADAQDTLDWIDAQDFSNGNVAITGTSYAGFTALAAAITNHPTLKVVFAGGSPSNALTDGFMYGGPLNLVAVGYLNYSSTGRGFPLEYAGFLDPRKQQALLSEPDLRKYDVILYGHEVAEWRRLAQAYADPFSSYFKERQIFSRLRDICVPTYHIAGYALDGDMPDVVRNFSEIERNGLCKDKNKLILGNWDHGNSTPVGNGANLSPFMKERFDSLLAHFLKNQESPYANEARVRVVSHVSDTFLSSPNFPIKELRTLELFLTSQNSANVLSREQKTDLTRLSYSYVPTQSNDNAGAQLLTFKSQGVGELAINGNVTLRAYVSTNLEQADLMASLYKLDAEGTSKWHSNCLLGGRVFGKDAIQKFEATCPAFQKFTESESLVLEIKSMIFPYFARNTGRRIEEFFSGFESGKVNIEISKDHPSSLFLTLE